MKKLNKIILSFLIIIMMSCNKTEKKQNDSVEIKNQTTLISTDKEQLEKIINLNIFKPNKVKFKYILIDNSENNKRFSVPGPSDRYLEAVLYFDKDTFNKLIIDNAKLSTISIGNKEDYDFEWLENDIKLELSNMFNSFDYPPTFFITGGFTNGGYFMLNNKILIKLYSN